MTRSKKKQQKKPPKPHNNCERKRVGSSIPLFKFKIHYKAIVTKIGLQILKQTHKPI